ncbi:hypothetical protein EV199_5071 [Pseudobacter ginsenosidimutans]|uniref:Uncharacterized protein n=1 Tax=Pseudobacter ginsenosidimutans TaxID=661488 RepID=A0A4Q7MLI7_9BACT|nr:hypothetical protein EV199_5071 [Pseudobacter ginsenosidimutans]
MYDEVFSAPNFQSNIFLYKWKNGNLNWKYPVAQACSCILGCLLQQLAIYLIFTSYALNRNTLY